MLQPARRGGINGAVMNAGPLLVVLTVIVSVACQATAWSPTVPSWAVATALVALALGIPHGAVDHLAVTTLSSTVARLAGGLVYLAVAAAATATILRVPAPAFVAVLAMSVWHFGTGDVGAAADLAGRDPHRRGVRLLQALALGSAPVLLPLTSASAVASVGLINPSLATVLHPAVGSVVRYGVLCLVAVTLAALWRVEDRRGCGELALLAVLGLVANPLMAFAVYFAAWHALRHTARLAMSRDGDVRLVDLARTFAMGLPALVGAVVVAGVCVLALEEAALGTWLWIGLALVWGLTVPHMVLVSRADRSSRRRRGRRRPVGPHERGATSSLSRAPGIP